MERATIVDPVESGIVRDRPEWIVAQVDDEELLASLEAMRAHNS